MKNILYIQTNNLHGYDFIIWKAESLRSDGFGMNVRSGLNKNVLTYPDKSWFTNAKLEFLL
jgi:hypothetical protein